MIGCGAVGQCSIQLILKTIDIPPKNISIIDSVDLKAFIKNINNEINFEIQTLTEENFTSLLARYLKPGDICIDLANEVDTRDILDWCQHHNVMYLNTCLNCWPSSHKPTLYELYKPIVAWAEKNKKSTTAVIAHGANPGLISSFVKQGLLDCAQHFLANNPDSYLHIETPLKNENFKELAKNLGIKAIHVSEKDSQKISKKIQKQEVINTWSIVEFLHEASSPSEFAWGTHEKEIPKNAQTFDGNIMLDNQGLNSQLKSWVPYEEFKGMIISHDEAYTIADYLSIKENNSYAYRPTTLFVYEPCPAAKQSLLRFQKCDFSCQLYNHIIKNEIVDGADKLGCLLMNGTFSWWTGSIVSIQESNHLVPGQNATVLQVSAGVIAALHFMLGNPNQGICFPETLNHREVIKIAKPFLGDFFSGHVNWNQSPLCNFKDYVVKL